MIKLEVNCEGSDPLASYFQEHTWRLENASCIKSNLQDVLMSGFKGELSGISLITFILKNARALKKLTINLNRQCSEAGQSAVHNLAHVVMASPMVKFVVNRSL